MQEPWRTMQHAALFAPACGTVVVQSGSYSGPASDRPLNWQADGTVVVEVGGPVQSWNIRAGFLRIQGFVFTVSSSYAFPLVKIGGSASLVFSDDRVAGQPVSARGRIG